MFSLIITERNLVCNITTPTSVAFLYSTGGRVHGERETKATKGVDTNLKDEKENFEKIVGKSRPETARGPGSRIKR